MSQVIGNFCGTYNNVYINTNGITDSFRGIYTDVPYIPNPGTGEEGKIYIETLAQPIQSCGTIVVDYDSCVNNFVIPINKYNIGDAYGKQGGIWYTECLMFYISPHPSGCEG